MFRLKAYCLILLVGLLAPACTGYELRPATPAATEETPTQAATPVLTEMPFNIKNTGNKIQKYFVICQKEKNHEKPSLLQKFY